MRIMDLLLTLKSQSCWDYKKEGVILVEKESDIEPLFKLLCEQDDYWEEYRELIKVAPSQPLESESQICQMCEYCGKTDIDNIKALQKKISFFLYQKTIDY